MERRPAYLPLTLAEKHAYAKSTSLSRHWCTQSLPAGSPITSKSPELSSTLLFKALSSGRRSSPLCRTPNPAESTSDAKIMGKITEFKAWHDNATIKGSTVLKIAQREGVELPSGTPLSREWLYRFQQRTGLLFSLRHGKGSLVDEKLIKEELKDLQDVVAGYHRRDVYNMDETAFYYRREPRGSLTTNKKET